MSNENLSVIGNLEEKIPALAEVMWKDLQSALKKDRFQAARPGQERNGPLLYLIRGVRESWAPHHHRRGCPGRGPEGGSQGRIFCGSRRRISSTSCTRESASRQQKRKPCSAV